MAKVLSIELGQSIVRICEVDYKVKKPKMYQSLEVVIPDGTVADGVINNPIGLGEAIKDAMAEMKFSTNKVVFCVSSTKIAIREALLPYVKAAKLNDVVQATAGDYFPVDISQSKIAFQVLGVQEKEENKKQYRVMLIAVPNMLLETYYDLAKECGWDVLALDYAANSIHSAVKDSLSDGVQMIIKMDEKATQLFVYSEQEPVLQRVVPYGGDLAIAELIDVEQKKGNRISYTEALRNIRINQYIFANEEDIEVDEEDDEQEGETNGQRYSVAGELAVLTSAIYRVMDYYNSRNSGQTVERIYITGSSEEFIGLPEYLTHELGVKVSTFSDFLAKNGKPVIAEGGYLACLGATMAPLDLIPDAHLSKKQRRERETQKSGAKLNVDPMVIGVAVLVTGAVVSLVLVAMSAIPYRSAKKTNEQLVQREAELAPIEDVYRDSIRAKLTLDEAKKVFFASRTPNENMSLFFEELEEILPSNVNVLTFSADNEGISINMNVASKEAVAQTLIEFRKLSSLSNVTVSSVTEEEDEVGVVNVNFTIDAIYAPIYMEPESAEAAVAQ